MRATSGRSASRGGLDSVLRTPISALAVESSSEKSSLEGAPTRLMSAWDSEQSSSSAAGATRKRLRGANTHDGEAAPPIQARHIRDASIEGQDQHIPWPARSPMMHTLHFLSRS